MNDKSVIKWLNKLNSSDISNIKICSEVYLYSFHDIQDADLCRTFLLAQESNEKKCRERYGRMPYPPSANLTIGYFLQVSSLDENTEPQELRDTWDAFIGLMVTERNSENAIRGRYPWGVWRGKRDGEIPDAPAMFNGITVNEADGLYQIHHYEDIEEE